MGDIFDDRIKTRDDEPVHTPTRARTSFVTKSGSPMGEQSGFVEVYENGRLTKRYRAEIAWGTGADMGRYPYVKIVLDESKKS